MSQLSPIGIIGHEELASEDDARSSVAARRRSVLDLTLRNGMVGALIVLAIVGEVLSPGFLSVGNIKIILSQNAAVGLVAVGMTFVLITGGFDLSVGALVALGGVLGAHFALSMPVGLAFLLTAFCGAAAGVLNGAVITRLRVNAFVATLGTASIFIGAAYIISSSQPIQVSGKGFQWLGYGEIASLPASVVILVAAFVVGGVILARTVYGNAVYIVGGNREAARLVGMRVDLITLSGYVLTGVLSMIAGLITAAQTGVGQANVGGDITLDAIAIVIIGGTSLLGGEGAMWRTAVGMLILAMMNNLFSALALEQSVQSVVKGVIVIAAVSLDAFARSRRV
jgi:ribose transport system permease protein